MWVGAAAEDVVVEVVVEVEVMGSQRRLTQPQRIWSQILAPSQSESTMHGNRSAGTKLDEEDALLDVLDTDDEVVADGVMIMDDEAESVALEEEDPLVDVELVMDDADDKLVEEVDEVPDAVEEVEEVSDAVEDDVGVVMLDVLLEETGGAL